MGRRDERRAGRTPGAARVRRAPMPAALRPLALLALAAVLAGCAARRPPPGDDAPTLASLAGRVVALQPDDGLPRDEARAIAAYREFLAVAPADDPQRREALRRLGDLEMDRADKAAGEGLAADYREAESRYRAYLKDHPQDPGNDRVLYQLARAQELDGRPEAALATLGRLAAAHPRSAHLDESEFRRGELLFGQRRWAEAEEAYTRVLAAGAGNPYRDRALYMQGWARYKQARLPEALESLFGVLDTRLGGAAGEPPSRAEQELLEDTLRVVSLSLDGLGGAAAIAPLVTSPRRQGYEYRVYRQLGELYQHQERAKDAADTFAMYARLRPLAREAPQAQAQVIAIYQKAGFDTLALAAKRDFVLAYGAGSGLRSTHPELWREAQPAVREHLAELARHHHALAQRTRAAGEVDEAVRWYRAGIAAAAEPAAAAGARFMLAELLREAGRDAEAAPEYELAAYGGTPHPRAADAGYAALLSWAAQVQRVDAAARPPLQRAQVESARHFADTFADDPRVPPVLAHAAETLFALGDADGAGRLARRLLSRPAPDAQRRVAHTVLAHAAFDRGAWAEAEADYRALLGIVPADDAGRAALVERHAAAVYRQGEAARDAGRTREALAHFERVQGGSGVAVAAQFDAAAAQIALKDWAGAARTLEALRRQQPGHALAAEAAPKLALAYLELGRWADAAREFEAVAGRAGAEPEAARAALWQAAELHDKAGAKAAAARSWETYLARWPQPLEAASQARWRLATLAAAQGRPRDETRWLKALREADAQGGDARTPRTRELAALAAVRLAAPLDRAAREVALVEPLKRSLQRRKARLDEALAAYAEAAALGGGEGASAAAFHSAALYQDFGRAVLASQRPKRLSKAEREQYDVMLEEQAFPFEEKAVELHAANTRRTLHGQYDDGVRRSYAALREMRPLRWAKAERGGEVAAAPPGGAADFNRQGIAAREAGRFADARAAYEQALARDPAYAPARLNLGILFELYLHDEAQALVQYDTFQAQARDDTVARWIADLRNRKPQHALAAPAAPAEERR